jgi:hypothetical protein
MPIAQQGFDIARMFTPQSPGQPAMQPPPAPSPAPPAPAADDPAAAAPAPGAFAPPAPAGYDATAGAPPTAPPTAPPGMPGAAPGMDQFAAAMQSLRQPQAPGPPQSDPLSLLRMIIANPYLHQALQQPTMGPAAPRSMYLPMPAPGARYGARQMPLPLGAVMNAIYALAGQSMEQLNANTREDDPEVPEYLVGEDGEFLVDPASPEARAVLVSRLFEISESARSRPSRARTQRNQWHESGGDESELWAFEAGFTR